MPKYRPKRCPTKDETRRTDSSPPPKETPRRSFKNPRGPSISESYRDFPLRERPEEREQAKQRGDDAHNEILEKAEKFDKLDKIDHIEETVEIVNKKVDDVGEAIVVLRQDNEALRRNVDVDEMSSDIVEGDD